MPGALQTSNVPSKQNKKQETTPRLRKSYRGRTFAQIQQEVFQSSNYITGREGLPTQGKANVDPVKNAVRMEGYDQGAGKQPEGEEGENWTIDEQAQRFGEFEEY